MQWSFKVLFSKNEDTVGWQKISVASSRVPLLSSLLAAVINANEIAVLNTIGEKKEKKAPTVMVCFLSSLHPRSKK